MQQRRLGSRGPMVSGIGMGTWALGGPFWAGEQPLGYGASDDPTSREAIKAAIDCGITLFDTADVYGTGHAETLLGEVLEPYRDQVVVATKWGNVFDPATRQLTGTDTSVEYLHRAVEASRRRLRTDRIDLLQMHAEPSPQEAPALIEAFEHLRDAGRIGGYGPSTDDPAVAALFAAAPGCLSVQFEATVLDDRPEMLDVCARHGVAGLARTPLAMGLLSGKYTKGSRLAADDVRGRQPEWLRWFTDGSPSPEYLERLELVTAELTAGGRTPAQGALAWLLARDPRLIPIPGCRTREQVVENTAAGELTPLAADALTRIDALLDR